MAERAGQARTTVVVATRDRRDQLLHALGRLEEVSGDPPVVVVDNGSTDGSPDAVRALFPAVTVIEAGANLGAVARTLGVRAAATRWVAFSDDDSWWGPGALDRAADLLEAAPRLAVVAGTVLIGEAEELDPVCGLMAASPLGRNDDLPGPSVLGFLACGAVVRRQAYLDVGGFDPVLHFLGEEELLARDLAAAGWGLAFVPEVVCHHHPQPSADRTGRRRLQTRNGLLSSWMSRPWPVPLRDTAAAVRRARDPEVRGALVDVARRLPAALAARRPLPTWVEHDVRLLEGA